MTSYVLARPQVKHQASKSMYSIKTPANMSLKISHILISHVVNIDYVQQYWNISIVYCTCIYS